MAQRSFWAQPTLVEWIVIGLVVLVLLAVLLPILQNIDAPPPRKPSRNAVHEGDNP